MEKITYTTVLAESGAVAADIAAAAGGKSPDNPVYLSVAVPLSLENWNTLLAAIESAGKFIDLDLSDCTAGGESADVLRANGVFSLKATIVGGRDKIVNITFPAAATMITGALKYDGNAFKGFDALQSVTGMGVTMVDGVVFSKCTGLKSVNLPQLTVIGRSAFADCTALTNINTAAITHVDTDAFVCCKALTSIKLSADIDIKAGTSRYEYTDNDDRSFEHETNVCEHETNVCEHSIDACDNESDRIAFILLNALNDCWRSDGYGNPFAGCHNLRFSITGTGRMSAMEDGKMLVRDNTELVAYPSASGTVVLPDSITAVGIRAFCGCDTLTGIELPQVAIIGDNAFLGCKKLTGISFPANTEIAGFPFLTYSKLRFTLTGAGCLSTLENGKMLVRENTELAAYPSAHGAVVIPDSITRIGNYAFFNCKTLTSVEALAVTNIGCEAFHHCEALSSVHLPQAESIGENAFEYCRALTSVSLPQVISISDDAFSNCQALTIADLPKVKSIGPRAFHWCKALTNVSFPAHTNIKLFTFESRGADPYSNCSFFGFACHPFACCPKLRFTLTGAGCLSTLEDGKILVKNNTELLAWPSVNGDIVLPDSITRIGDSAFHDCQALTGVNLPKVESVGENAFWHCSALTSVNIPRLASIGICAFDGCEALTSVDFPQVTSIGKSAFSGCDALTNINLPEGVTIKDDERD